MQRALRNNLVLIGIIALLGAAALADQMRARLAAPKPLLAIDPKSVHAIVLECPECPRRTLEKIAGHWEMSEPYALPADPARVDALVAIARAPVTTRYGGEKIAADKVGLTPPYATLTLGGRKLEFGTTEALRNERYVRVGGEIVLVPDRFSHLLRLAPEALLDPRPFGTVGPIAHARLSGVELDAAARDMLTTLAAQRVGPAPTAAHGRALEVELAAGGRLELELTRYGDEWQLVRRAPAVAYVLDAAAADALVAAATPAAKSP